MSELLPCPFCGEREHIDPRGWFDGDGDWAPQCQECGATAESVEFWNRRTPSAEQCARVEQLDDALQDEHEHRVSAEASLLEATARIKRLEAALEQYGMAHQDAVICGQGYLTVLRKNPSEIVFSGEIIRQLAPSAPTEREKE